MPNASRAGYWKMLHQQLTRNLQAHTGTPNSYIWKDKVWWIQRVLMAYGPFRKGRRRSGILYASCFDVLINIRFIVLDISGDRFIWRWNTTSVFKEWKNSENLIYLQVQSSLILTKISWSRCLRKLPQKLSCYSKKIMPVKNVILYPFNYTLQLPSTILSKHYISPAWVCINLLLNELFAFIYLKQ